MPRRAIISAPLRMAMLAALLVSPWLTAEAWGQGEPPPPPPQPATAQTRVIALADAADRPISALVIEGLDRVDEQLVRNQIRSAVGGPLDVDTVRNDVKLLTRLGEFASIDAVVELQPDGSVKLIYRVVEQPIVTELQVVGNKVVSDQEIFGVVTLSRRGPRDNFAIQNSVRAIENLYRKRGFYLTHVEVDESELGKSGILVLRVIEGPRVRIKAIEFEGSQAFTDKQLRSQVSTSTWFPLLRKGELDEEKLLDDVGKLDAFYKDRGYLDVRVDRRVELSPDNKEAKVTFLVVEGEPYILRTLATERPGGKPLTVLNSSQVAAMIELKTGDVYRRDKLRQSIATIREAYAQLGYLPLGRGAEDRHLIDVEPYEVRVGEEKLVDLLLEIDEGRMFDVGEVIVSGNFLTKDKVIRREIRLDPGRPFDASEIDKSLRRLQLTRLFNDVRITVQEPRSDEAAESASAAPGEPSAPPEAPAAKPDQPGQAEDDAGQARESRDVLVEVKERNTGSLGFGAAIGSDSGFYGDISLTQENFDIADLPESWDELIRGRAFRGAGQKFNLTLRPGTTTSQYALALTEPNFLDTNLALGGTTFYRTREYEDYTEDRFHFGSIRVAKRFGEVWEAGVNARFERVELTNLSIFGPVDIFEDAGPSTITGIGFSLTRTTVPNVPRPGKGSRLELGIEQVGAIGGDFAFTTLSGDYTVFLTLDEDFFGRKSILKLNTRVGYILDEEEAPLYERMYLGGRSFRGFQYRTISPKGVNFLTGQVGDDPVGGSWLFFMGAQYEVPIFEEVITAVAFLDSGTVTNEPGLDSYRAAFGIGLRLYIPQLGPNPIAFDLGFPLLKEEGDDEQLFSFAAELPF